MERTVYLLIAMIRERFQPRYNMKSDGEREGGVGRAAVAVFLVLVLAYTLFLGYNSLSLEGQFSPDSVVYIDAAQNLSAGRGLSSSMVRLQRLVREETTPPLPMTVWAPLFPILLAALDVFQVPPAAGALAVPVIFLAVVLVSAWLLVARLYDRAAAMFAVAFLIHQDAVRHVSTHAWTEMMGMALLFMGLGQLIRARSEEPASPSRALVAGLLCGLAVATRFALLPLVPFGFLLVLRRELSKSALLSMAAYAAGSGLIVGAVFGRIFWLTGRVRGVGGNSTNVAMFDLARNLFDALVSAVTISGLIPLSAFVLFSLAALASFVFNRLHERRTETLRSLIFSKKRWVLILWPILYLCFLFYAQTRVLVDATSVRLVFPAVCVAFLFVVAAAARGSGIRAHWLVGLAFALLGIGLYTEIGNARNIARVDLPPVYTLESNLKPSETLTWLSKNASTGDLLIAEDGYDLPFFIGPVDTAYFMPSLFPKSRIQYDFVASYLNRTNACGRHANVYLVINAKSGSRDLIRQNFGAFTADLITGDLDGYPGIHLQEDLEDGMIFRIVCNELVHPRN